MMPNHSAPEDTSASKPPAPATPVGAEPELIDDTEDEAIHAPPDEPADKPAERPDEKKPAEVPAEVPAEDAAEEPAEVPTEAPVEKPAEQPAEVLTEEPEAEPTEAPVEKPVEEAEKPADKPAEDVDADKGQSSSSGDSPNDATESAAGDTLTDDSSTAPHFGSLDPADKSKISKFHFLIPASNDNLNFCINLVSSVVTRYAPMVLGWNATGIFDARESHLAKMHAINRYFDTLPPDEDDGLVLIVDGYDIIMQLPAEVMIERYFDVAYKADEVLAKKFGLTVDEARAQGIRQTIFWGPDKICWPNDGRQARCWAAPVSGLPHNAFGPKSGNGEMYYSDPRWLNSGTVIGPVADLRRYIKATLREIDETYNADFVNSESDQYYLSNIWGRQEWARLLHAAGGNPEEAKGGPHDRKIPQLKDDEDPEFHISIDYESSMFQTKAGYEPFFGYLQFNQSDMNAQMSRDMFDEGSEFKPFDIQMPPNVVAAMSRMYDDIPDEHPGARGSDWVRTVELGTNFITKHIYGLWHCTGPKEWIKGEYRNLWFEPFAKPLLKAAVKASQTEELLTEAHIDGRRWASKFRYPDAQTISDERGGAWTDYNDLTFVPWNEMCADARYHAFLFEGQEWKS